MKLSDYTQYDGLGLAELIRNNVVSVDELAQTALDAIAKINPQINAVIETYPERASAVRASELSDGAFYGVPFLIKDLAIMEAGKRMEAGSRLMEGMVAPFNSELMTRYNRAGFNNLGRTTCPEFGFSCATESVLRGPTCNPWETGRVAGGSSGGAAASVAAGMVPLAHGNDAGGSIRVPAACCGIFGLKPTRGRISLAPGGDGFNGLATEHVLSRTVRDSAAALDMTHGYLPGDPYGAPVPQRPYLDECQQDPISLMIAFSKVPNGGQTVDPEVAGLVEQAAALCEELGHFVEQAAPAWDEEAFNKSSATLWAANCTSMSDMMASLTGRNIDTDTLETITLASYKFGKSVSGEDFVKALETVNQISRQAAPFFDHYDILLTPTLSKLPIEHGLYSMNDFTGSVEEWFVKLSEFGSFSSIYNTTGQPAMSVPLFNSITGLPVGIQFAARYGDEGTLFQLAGQLERAYPWADRIPRVHASAPDGDEQ
jgi:amidase